MTTDEWKLIREAIVQGDEWAFGKLYNGLWSRLYAVAFNYVRDKATAQEIVQEVFIKLWLRREELGNVLDIHAFALQSTKFRIYDHFDKQAVQEKYVAYSLKHGESQVNDAHQLAEFNETRSRIERELACLPETTQRVFRLSRQEQFSNKEIASNMKLSVKAVEYHITQSLKHLRLKLGNLLVLFATLAAHLYHLIK
ncbi:MAG TPA: RNA polymerase sigma-70 factor [Chryseolinea sp.]|nr:RNA polymerase sigma-70 factor [Chryseolinea sp.]